MSNDRKESMFDDGIARHADPLAEKIARYTEERERSLAGINPQPRSVDEAAWKAYEQPVPVKNEAMAIAKLKPKTLRGRFVAWLARILRAS